MKNLEINYQSSHFHKMRRWKNRFFQWVCACVTWMAVAVLLILIYHILIQGLSWLDVDFLLNFQSRYPEKAGIKAAIVGSIWLITMTACLSVPIGVGTALFLEEYTLRKKRWVKIIQININNLAGMPSIVYGLLGLALFVRFFGLGRSLWAASMTLGLLVLPMIIITSQEAIRAVPATIREAGYGLGAHRWQVLLQLVLPAALPGILTGIILSVSRVMGETAPLIMVGALSYVAFLPEGPSDSFTVLPMQIFNWASRPQEEFHYLAAAAIIVLLVILFLMSLGAIMIRQKFQKYKL